MILLLSCAPSPEVIVRAVTVSPAAPTTLDQLVASADLATSTETTLAWTWTVDGAVVAEGPTLAPGAARGGQLVVAQLVATPTRGPAVHAESSPVEVANLPPSAPAWARIVPVEAYAGGPPLRCLAAPATDPDGDELALRVAWFHDGQPVEGVEVPDPTPGAWSCTALYSDGIVDGAAASASIELVGGPGEGADPGWPGGYALWPTDDVAIHVGQDGVGNGLAPLGDLDGDGYADLVAGHLEAAPARVLYGGPEGVAASTPVGLGGGTFAREHVTAGDLDGDGDREVILARAASGRVLVYATPDGQTWDDDPTAVVEHPTATEGSVAEVGDTDGDGLTDLLLAAPGTDGTLHAWLVPAQDLAWGTSTPADAAALVLAAPPATARLVTGPAGDVDGDGLADLGVGAPDLDEQAGRAWVVPGRQRGWIDLGTAPVQVRGSTSWACVGGDVERGGDLDGDDRGDLLLGSAPDCYVAAGLVALLGADLAQGGAWTDQDSEIFDASVFIDRSVHAADLTGDGTPELLLGSTYTAWGFPFGFAEVHDGARATADGALSAASLLQGWYSADYTADPGAAMIGAGDVDGDGTNDLAVGAPLAADGDGQVGIRFTR